MKFLMSQIMVWNFHEFNMFMKIQSSLSIIFAIDSIHQKIEIFCEILFYSGDVKHLLNIEKLTCFLSKSVEIKIYVLYS